MVAGVLGQPGAAATAASAVGMSPSPRRGDRGAVTAETVMVLPVLVAVAMALTWLLGLAATQVRVVDAAREVARAEARAEARDDSVAIGRRVAPSGAEIVVREERGVVVVTVVAPVPGPGGLLGFLPTVRLRAQAVAASERS